MAKDNTKPKTPIKHNRLNQNQNNLSFPLLQKIGHYLFELRGLLYAGLVLMLMLMLFSYHPDDPGWFQTSLSASVIHNYLGVTGAYIAQGLLYLIGFSTWLFVILLLTRLVAQYRSIMARLSSDDKTSESDSSVYDENLWLVGIGFVMFFMAFLGFEFLYNSPSAHIYPFGAGGLLGFYWGNFSLSMLGETGTLILFSLLFVLGSSCFFGFSWLDVCERIGAVVYRLIHKIRAMRSEREDLKIAKADQEIKIVKAEEQEIRMVQMTQENDDAESLDEHHIHLMKTERPAVRIESAVAKIEPSLKMLKRSQSQLFSDDSDVILVPIDLLDKVSEHKEVISNETIEYTSRLIEKKLADFGVQVHVENAQAGPVITRYEIEPAVGVKGSQIVNLANDLARSLSLVRIRVVETIPGKNLMGLELPNPRRQMVRLSEIISSKEFGDSKDPLIVALGKDIAGNPVVGNLAKMPHLLVAGTTGSGKSVGINAMILSLLYKSSPKDVKLILIDPKMLEMSIYEGIPHLLAPVVTDMPKAGNALNWCVTEMDRRYKLLSKLGVRNIASYNQKVREALDKGEPIPNPFTLTPELPEPLEPLPMIVVIIDELADLMMVLDKKKIEELIARLAQKARAAGIHLILATQRPSVDVITGLIKANVPTRIAFQVSSKVDSRTILDQMGAETLLGLGDMLYLKPGTGMPMRVHGAFVDDHEVQKVVDFLKEHYGEAQYVDEVLEGANTLDSASGAMMGGGSDDYDPLYDQAVAIVLESGRASISYVQRNLKIGYNRAANILEQMERDGVVSAMQSNGSREILRKSLTPAEEVAL